MTDKTLLSQMLGIVEPWKIKEVRLDVAARSLEVEVECERTEWFDEQGRRLWIHGYEERTWRHLDAFEFRTTLTARVPRLQHPGEADEDKDDDGDGGGSAGGSRRSGATALVKVPWAEKGSRWTALFERFAVEVLHACGTVSAAAALLRLTWDEAHGIMKRAVKRGLERRLKQPMPFVGLDEKSFGRGQDYISVLVDLHRGCVHEVCPGRRQEDAEALLRSSLPEAAREEVSVAVIDMSAAYAAAVRAALPSAAIVYDRFHVSQLLNKAMDAVRRAEHRRLLALGDGTLTGTKMLWLSDPHRLSPAQLDTFAAVSRRNALAARAWEDKENFASFWDQPTERRALAFFEQWENKVRRRRSKGLEPIKKAAASLRAHLEGLLAYISHPLTNALAEGLNSLIQRIKSAARGFRNYANYRTRILFFLAKLDLLPA